MSFQNRFVRLAVAGVIGIVVGLLFLPLQDTQQFRELESVVDRWRYTGEPFKPMTSDRVVMVLIDEQTVRDLKENGYELPYQWMIHEYVLDYIRSGDPAAVCYDLIFTKRTYENQEQDLKKFAKTTNSTPVVHPLLARSEQDVGPTTAQFLYSSYLQSWNRSSLPVDQFHRYTSLDFPVPELVDQATGLGTINMTTDTSGTVRHYPLFQRIDGNAVPSLGLSTLDTARNGSIRSGLHIESRDYGYELSLDDQSLPLNQQAQLPLLWYGKSNTFPSYSFTSILNSYKTRYTGNENPDIPAKTFEDKIVIVGTDLSANMLNRPTDTVPTPTEAHYLAPEVHATAVSNLLKGHSLQPLSPKINALLILLVSLTTALLVGNFIYIRWQLVSGIGIFLAYVVAAVWGFREWMMDVPLLPPVGAGFVSFSLVSFLNYFTEGKRLAFIRENFGRLVPDPALKELESSFNLARAEVGQKQNVTILFADIRRFTDFSEHHHPEEVVAFLNEYFGTMIDVLQTHGGTFDKYMGDAILAYFGAPHKVEHPERAAVEAALDMKQSAKDLMISSDRPHPDPIAMGIGINTDDVVLGFMGGHDQIEYTAIGDGVNLASRLEGLTKRYGADIIVSEFTRKQIESGVVFRCLDRVRVKGKNEAVDIFEVMGRPGENDRIDEIAEAFDRGVEAYRQRDWDRAKSAFRHVLSLKPEDKPSKIMLNRTSNKKESPPGPNWEPIQDLTEK